MTGDRRKSPRRAVLAPAELSVAGRTSPVVVRDICRDAALVESEQAFEVGSEVHLRLILPGLSPIDVLGRIIRSEPGQQHPYAQAVLFSEVLPGDATRLDFFVALYDERTPPGG